MPTLLTLPWRWTGSGRPEHAVIFASRFDTPGTRAGWQLFMGGLRLRRAVLHSAGALGVSVRAHPLKGAYYTLSLWEDEASLLAFAGSVQHRAAVRTMADLGTVQGVLLSRGADSRRPRWRSTLQWVDAAPPGPYASGCRSCDP